MSLSVELERVQAEAARRATGGFLLTVSDDGRPHIVAVNVDWDGAAPAMSAGRTSVRNAARRPGVSVFWPPTEPGGYSLIVDGDAVADANPAGDGGRITVEMSRAVLHRPATQEGEGVPDATAGDATACSSDCVPLLHQP